jgi:hypothetical protein
MTKREKILISVVLILAVLCVFFIYFLQPCLNEINNIKTDMVTKGIDVSNKQQMESRLVDLDKQISEGENKIISYGSGITTGFDQPSILVYLKETITKYGEKIMYTFTDISPLGQLQVCPVTINMTGTYSGIKSILSELGAGKYLVKVTGLEAYYHVFQTEDAGTEQDTSGKKAASPTPAPSADTPKNILDIILHLEFYNYPGDVPPDTSYPFAPDSMQYGGDIFF